MRDRIRENRTSGSVRGEGGDILTYSAGDLVNGSSFVEMVEAGVRIGLERAFKVTRVPLRMFAAAIG